MSTATLETTAMRVIADRVELLAAATACAGVIKARSPKPILQCVMITAKDRAVELAATDLEIAIRCKCEKVQLESPGATVVSAEKFRDIIAKMDEDTVHLELVKDTLVIKGNSASFKLFTQSPKDFPPVIDEPKEYNCAISQATLRRLIGQCIFACDPAAAHFCFGGIAIKANKNDVTFRAAESKSSVIVNGTAIKCTAKTAEGSLPIIPERSANIINKLLAGDPEDVANLSIEENRVVVAVDSFVFYTNLLEGNFPPLDDYVPKDCDKMLTVGVEAMIRVIEQAAMLATELDKGVRFDLSRSGIKLTTRSPQEGEAEVSLACKYEGAELAIRFNPKYVLAGLKAVNADEVKIEFTSPNRPALMTAPNFTYVFMPMNLK